MYNSFIFYRSLQLTSTIESEHLSPPRHRSSRLFALPHGLRFFSHTLPTVRSIFFALVYDRSTTHNSRCLQYNNFLPLFTIINLLSFFSKKSFKVPYIHYCQQIPCTVSVLSNSSQVALKSRRLPSSLWRTSFLIMSFFRFPLMPSPFRFGQRIGNASSALLLTRPSGHLFPTLSNRLRANPNFRVKFRHLIPLLGLMSFSSTFDLRLSHSSCGSPESYGDSDDDDNMESQLEESPPNLSQVWAASSTEQRGNSASQEGSLDQLNSEEHEFFPVRRRSRAHGFNATLEQNASQHLPTSSLQRACSQTAQPLSEPIAATPTTLQLLAAQPILPTDQATLPLPTLPVTLNAQPPVLQKMASPLAQFASTVTTSTKPTFASFLRAPQPTFLIRNNKRRTKRLPQRQVALFPTRVVVDIGCYNTFILLSPADGTTILSTTPRDLLSSFHDTGPHFDQYHFLTLAPFDLDSNLSPLTTDKAVKECSSLDKYYEVHTDSRSRNLLSMACRVLTSQKNILDLRSMMEPWTKKHHVRLSMPPAAIPPEHNWPAASDIKTNYVQVGWLLFSTPDLNRLELQHLLTMELYKEDPSTRWLNDPLIVTLEPLCNIPVDGIGGEITPAVWIKCMNLQLLPTVEHLLHKLFSSKNHLDRPLSRFLTFVPLRFQRDHNIDTTTWNYYFRLQKSMWSPNYQHRIVSAPLHLDPYQEYDFRDHPQHESTTKMTVRRYVMSRTNLGNYPLALGVDRLYTHPWRTDVCSITFHPTSTGFDQQQILTGTVAHLERFLSIYPLNDPRHDGNEPFTPPVPPPALIPPPDSASADDTYFYIMTSQINESVSNLLLPTFSTYAAEHPAKRLRPVDQDV